MQRDANAELHVCFRRSFDVVLKPHLPFMVRPVVAVRAHLSSIHPILVFVSHPPLTRISCAGLG